MPTADVSARPAVPGDEEAIADIQLAAWRTTLGADAVADLPRDQIVAQWGSAIEAPPSREHRMFVATDGPHVVGFAALAQGEIIALEVAPEHRRYGHGSRLLAACVDTLRILGTSPVRTWAIEGDTVREAFLTSAGFAEGGIRRGMDGPGGEMAELMWRAEIGQ
ncbi:GNAT family N-acetyltransferase [Demequina sp. NBRC 110057]|uniref:GNAT family N-acetyltransferase n=1 Tax=Demequina sp. NBRC 110057 TaxID=1570346 RepID=UPI000A05C7C6|nr:GNAT family N-acetyltransferase [Demequina sp. NBRC 110057]